MKTPRLLAAIIVLQVLTLAGQWVGPVPVVAVAEADIPDPAAQRNRMIEEMKTTNSKLDRLLSVLESGKLKVQVDAPADAKK